MWHFNWILSMDPSIIILISSWSLLTFCHICASCNRTAATRCSQLDGPVREVDCSCFDRNSCSNSRDRRRKGVWARWRPVWPCLHWIFSRYHCSTRHRFGDTTMTSVVVVVDWHHSEVSHCLSIDSNRRRRRWQQQLTTSLQHFDSK